MKIIRYDLKVYEGDGHEGGNSIQIHLPKVASKRSIQRLVFILAGTIVQPYDQVWISQESGGAS